MINVCQSSDEKLSPLTFIHLANMKFLCRVIGSLETQEAKSLEILK